MAMTPGLSPNLRLVDDEPAPNSSEDVIIEMAEEPPERKVTDDKGNVLEIEYPDGSIAISLDGKPIERNDNAKDKNDWFRNLVEDIDDTLARLGKLGATVVDEVVNYQNIYRLCYVRGPEGILIGLAQQLGQQTSRENPMEPKH